MFFDYKLILKSYAKESKKLVLSPLNLFKNDNDLAYKKENALFFMHLIALLSALYLSLSFIFKKNVSLYNVSLILSLGTAISFFLYIALSNLSYFIRHFKEEGLTFFNLESLYSLLENKDKSLTKIFLGFGFEFNQIHRQRYDYEVLKEIKESNDNNIGDDRVHRLDLKNNNKIFFDTKHINGHTLILGTTGTGKTKLLISLISQAILRDESVIILDPKNDDDLYKACINACKFCHKENDFYELKLSVHNSHNIALNLFNVDKSSLDIANALSSMMESSIKDNFSEYAKNAVLACVSVLNLNQDSITIRNIRNSILDLDFFKLSLYLHFRSLVLTLKDKDAYIYFKRLHAIKESKKDVSYALCPIDESEDSFFKESALPKSRALKISNESLRGFYNYLVIKNLIKKSSDIECIFSVISYDRNYYSKIASSLIPKLNLLCDDTLVEVLDRDKESIPLEYICNNNKVFYIGLNFLKNSLLAENFGKLILSELCFISGKRYEQKQDHTRLNLFVDEVSELIYDPLMQLLNKSRGSNMAITLATQTIEDLSKNKKDLAMRVVGNCNTLISLRLRDEHTLALIENYLKKADLKNISSSQNMALGTRANLDLSSAYKVSYDKECIFPKDALLTMSNFHFIAYLADGRFIKGILPFIEV